MKKTLSIVLALALALSMFASLAFVLGPSSGVTGATNSALNITKFFTTFDKTNLIGGTRLYAPIVDKTDSAFAKNELIQFCVEFEVLNAKTVSNGVDSKKANGISTLLFSSDTVNLSVNQYPGQMALYEDAGMALVNAVKVGLNNINPNTGTTVSGYQGNTYNTKKNELSVSVEFTQAENATRDNGFTADGIYLKAPASYKDAKATYSLIFSGVTKGEITEKGSVQMKTAYKAGSVFTGGAPVVIGGEATTSGIGSSVEIDRNGRHYMVQKVASKWTKATADTSIPNYAEIDTVGYKISLGTKNAAGTYDWTTIAQFDTEVVKYKNIDIEVNGTDVEGLGVSLGLVEYAQKDATAGGTAVKVFKTVLQDGTTVYLDETGAKAFTTTDGAADAGKLARFQTCMDDFGFKTDVGYTYKLTDALFTFAGAFSVTREATYNNGTVVPVEPEADEPGDVEEPTDEDPVDEEPADEEPADEEPGDEEPEAPTTGDAASSVAIALAAAAIVAAAALAVVMKKARD